jgi:hypothetical protein
MKRPLLLLLSVTCTIGVTAQVWELHVAAGASYGRLLPAGQSTPRTSVIRYGFSQPGLYFSPELAFNANPHSRFTFGYQYSDNPVGIQFLPYGRSGPRTMEYDVINLNNFSVGYTYRQYVWKEHLLIGGFVKAGLAYGMLNAIGGGGSSGIQDHGGYLIGASRLTEFEVMPDFWAPTTTLGFTVAPNVKGRKLAERLSVDVSVTACWKNPYTSYSKMQYTLVNSSSSQQGVAQFQGAPLLLQLGLDYSLFHFGKKAVK